MIDRRTEAPRVVVAGRYAGVVDVLAAVLVGAGCPPLAACAIDREGGEGVRRVLRDADVAVVTVGPGDPTLGWLPRGADGGLVVVTWHPDDERPPLPRHAVVVPAGRIRAGLAAAVRAAAAGARA